jgi:DMSO reductase anchor subunit
LLVSFYGLWAVALTLAAFVTRAMSLLRNARLKPLSTPQTAIGVRHSRIQQRSQGASAGSFNTREFLHGASPRLFRSVRWVFLVLCFPLPVLLLFAGLWRGGDGLFQAAFLLQYAGLVAERWYFFADANHPQNLYYKYVS